MARSRLSAYLPPALQPFGWLIAPLVVLLLVAIIAMSILPGMVKVDAYGEELVMRVEQLTGRDFSYDRAKVKLFPKAQITFYDVRLQNAPGTTRTYMMQVPVLEIPISMGAAFGGEAAFSEVILRDASLELESLPDGTDNWHFAQNATAIGSGSMKVTLQNSEIIYTDKRAGYVETMQGVYGSLSLSQSQLTLNAQMQLRRQATTLNASCAQVDFQNFQNARGNCDFTFAQGQNTLSYKGDVVRNAAGIALQGDASLSHSNLSEWLDIFYGQGQPLFTGYFANPLPVQFKAAIVNDASRFLFNASEFASGEGTRGKGFMDISRSESAPRFDAQLNFEAIDLDTLLGDTLTTAPTNEEANLLARKEGFPFELTGEVRIDAQSWKMGGAEGAAMLISGAFDRSFFNMNMAQFAFADKGRVAAKGAIKIDDKGPSFQGKVDVAVNTFFEAAPLFGLDTGRIPEAYNLPFRSRFDVSVTPEEVAASGVQAILGSSKIRGAVTVQPFANPPVLDSKFVVSALDLSPLYTHWFGEASLLDSPDQLGYNPFMFEGLQNLRWVWRNDLEVQNARYFERDHLKVKLKTTVQAGSVTAQRFELLATDGTNLEGSMVLKARDRQVPEVELTVNAGRLLLDDMFRDYVVAGDEERAKNAKNDQWTDYAFNFNPFLHADMTIKMAADSVFHEWFGAFDVMLDADVTNGKLTIRELTGKMWDGDWVIKSVLELGLIPQFSLGFTGASVKMEPFLEQITGRKQVSGLVNMSGQIQSTGLSFSDWMDTARGTLNLQAYDPVIQEMNVGAAIQAAKTQKTPAELRKQIETQFHQGSSQFRSLEGLLYLNQGYGQFTNMVLRSRDAAGAIEGNIRLSDYEVDMKVDLGLLALAGRNRNYPHLGLRIKGPLASPSTALETQELEGFISRK